MSRAGAAERLSLGVAATAALLAGFACMAAELTAVRVLAPHFGDSAYVWTNVIGVILFALACGAFLGGTLAASPAANRWPARLLVSAGCLLVLVPFTSGSLGAFLLPSELPLDAAMPAIVRGSLVASALLFVPPMLLLGAVAPLLVAQLARQEVAVGRAAGVISAAGTVGSLLGTFAATHWLVPQLGCRWSLLVSASILLAAGAMLARGGRVRAGVLLVALLAAGAGPSLPTPLRPVAAGRELIAEVESRYQFLQVQRDTTVDPAPTLLTINEALDSFHSIGVPGSCFTGGAYYDWHAIAPWLAGDGRAAEGLRVLSIGDAAGSLRRVYAGVLPGVQVDGVDIDPATMELGDEHFPGPKASGERHALDGRLFVQSTRGAWDVVHVDAYAHQVYVPAHLASRQFFAAVHARLRTNGLLACNVGGLHPDDPVLRAIGTTVATVFGHAIAMQVPNTRNFLLVARRGLRPDPACLAPLRAQLANATPADQAHWQRVVDAAKDPKVWYDVGYGGPVLVDDQPLLDELLHASYVARSDATRLLACAGQVDPRGAEIDAHEAWSRRNWPAVLAAVASSSRPTLYLRQIAGDARWMLRQLGAARLEYEAALALAEDPQSRARLESSLRNLAADAVPTQRAEAVASRNGWLQLLVISVLAALGTGIWRRAVR